MKVTLKWLREFVDINLPPKEVADRLTMAGTEAKGVQAIGGTWDNIVVGQIAAVNPHPNADRLRLPTVDIGTEQQTVVCGAPNLNVGDKIAFARVGAELIDGHTGEIAKLKPAKIRGVESSGMVCSEKELGISDNHTEILVLSADAPMGMPLANYLGDVILDLDITPNRPDCLCVIGIAREVAALTDQKLHTPGVAYEEAGTPIDQHIAVEIIDADLCPRYCASLITGVKIGESPQWMQQRLLACGMRPINNVVDVTNYVMLELGQPLHAFDYELIRGRKIIVRRATEGETITSLDGAERNLTRNMLVIADAERAVAIAGVMGGANSEVTEGTTSILLEAANFNPASIHYTGQHLSLPSEACMRFERGIRPGLTMPALKRATQLIVQLGGGQAARGVADAYPGKQEPEPVMISTERSKQVLGAKFTVDQITKALTSLGFECQPGASSTETKVTTPYWRSDITQEVDLIEEVARIIGYDKIPMTTLSQSIPPHSPSPLLDLERKIKDTLVGYGFQEALTYSLSSLEMLRRFRPQTQQVAPMPARLANPMTAEQEYLRPTLRANLLAALVANRRHEEAGIRLFELGKIYLPKANELPDEPEVLCGLLSGSRNDISWLGDGGQLGFFDAKAALERLFSKLGIPAGFKPGNDESFHPAHQAAIAINDKEIGVIGELHPKVTEAFDLAEAVYLFELNVTELLPFTTGHRMFQPIPRFPATVRDIALIVDVGVSHQQVVDIIRGFPLVKDTVIFDVYSGKQVPAGKKSLAYRITYQSPTHTLTDKEANKVQEQILKKLAQQLGATLRG
ncbi:MAG: phenylalanine--tRNA ligase subunit beta [Dehalococcoidales bacterium]|nr:phenylalanine--tRNA ligase subunit beta [Dehalococcoidales bacterium]